MLEHIDRVAAVAGLFGQHWKAGDGPEISNGQRIFRSLNLQVVAQMEQQLIPLNFLDQNHGELSTSLYTFPSGFSDGGTWVVQ
jgi:hypothetical protein